MSANFLLQINFLNATIYILSIMEVIMNNKGEISIDAQNIMPIIKKWLYSDKDIFIRELVANAVDAITKHSIAEPGAESDYKVIVNVDKDNGTLSFIDNGIGMSYEEVEKYINQVAFSSAEEFVKKYQGEDNKGDGGIIGHFGLGFYSAFMVAKKVSILTKSYTDVPAVEWISEDGMNFEMKEAQKDQRGTIITLWISDEEKEFLDSFRVREVLDRYCEFMKVPIYLRVEEDIQRAIEEDKKAKEEEEKKQAEENSDKKESENSEQDIIEPEKDTRSPEERGTYLINDMHPLWLKQPNECTDEEYKEFYHKAFKTWEDPLFQVHLNVDYPFNIKGILYFPRIKRDFGSNQGQIKLYSGQVFVAENIKEIIPEYLMLLNGLIDCPDLPLNVSRSYLQNDGFVNKMKSYITRKVADKLLSMFNNSREQYENYWDDIHPFIKYGCISDPKFYEQVKPAIILKNNHDKYMTIDEYINKNEEKIGKKIYYANDQKRQSSAIALYDNKGIDVAIFDMLIDNSFISFMEYGGGYEGLKFVRVDADIDGLAENSGELDDELKAHQENLEKMFRAILSNDTLNVKLKDLSDESVIAVQLQDEQGRRFAELSKIYGQNFSIPEQKTLVLNSKNPAVKALYERDANDDLTKLICKQVFDLSSMATRPLENTELKDFLSRSNELLTMLLK